MTDPFDLVPPHVQADGGHHARRFWRLLSRCLPPVVSDTYTIETARQREAALDWIRYWKGAVAAGDQSWLAQEQALEAIMQLSQSIDAFDIRVHDGAAEIVRSDVSITDRERLSVESIGETPAGAKELV